MLLLAAAVLLLVSARATYAQIGIGILDPARYVIMQLESNDKGVLFPRLTTAQRDAITNFNVCSGLTIYNKTVHQFQYWNDECWINAYQINCHECYFTMEVLDPIPPARVHIDRPISYTDSARVVAHHTAGDINNTVRFQVIEQALPDGIMYSFVNDFTIPPVTEKVVNFDEPATIYFYATPLALGGPDPYYIPLQGVCGSRQRMQILELIVEPCKYVEVLNDTRVTGVGNQINFRAMIDQKYGGGPDPLQPTDCATLIIRDGVEIASTDPNLPAIVTGNFFVQNVLAIYNQGKIFGKGGQGGVGYNIASGTPDNRGYKGGDCILLNSNPPVNRPIFFYNEGLIYAGGGGGAGSALIAQFSLGPLGTLCLGRLGGGGGGGAGGWTADGGGAGGGGLGNCASPVLNGLEYTQGGDGGGGEFAFPGAGGTARFPLSQEVLIATITVTPTCLAGDGGAMGYPGEPSQFLILIEIDLGGFIQIPFTFDAGTWIGFNNTPGIAGKAIVRNPNGNTLNGLPDNPNYQTRSIKGYVGP